ncbi:DNA integrity scanning diadenylate cyclase DisA [Austwickia chelonae]|uniref:DNA integrity scanning diadenylate cyclase DisA n=1 Tax=Austwickia chelonae TaxID=100225 RepID=UPI000E264324|nr:DNA integrity scanning diadenylate cyclase DisA [Austwickia chelonae]
MERTDEELLRRTLAAVAPGTALRDGLERILRGRTGALIVLGHDRVVETLCTGGFPIDIEFSATRLRELAKMDGAVVVNNDISRILRAATQLVPDATIETKESGTRHRTAERVAKQTGLPVISVSQSMRTIALYVGHLHQVLEAPTAVLSKADQALATLERYKTRLDEVTAILTALEVEDLVTLRDVALVVQRHEMVRRISEEVVGYVIELGTDGRLLSLQLEELIVGIRTERDLVTADYLHEKVSGGKEDAFRDLAALTASELLDLSQIAVALGHPDGSEALDEAISPRGQRILSKIPRLPKAVGERILEHFGGLQALLLADLTDFMAVEGVGETRAHSLREGLSRIAEASMLERYA